MSANVKSAGKSVHVNDATEKAQVNNWLGRSPFDRDHLYVAEGRRAFSGEAVRMQWQPDAGAMVMLSKSGRMPSTARYTSPLINCRFPATELLPSWNIRLGDTASQCFRIFLRAANENGQLSPWFFLGENGACDVSTTVKREAAGWGKTHIDYLELKKPAHAFQYRIDFTISDASPVSALPQLHRFFVHYSGRGKTARPTKPPTATNPRLVRVKVPYRSQLDVDAPKLRDHICCPTCVAMLLEQYGINQPTLTVCKSAYDHRYDMYGIWPKASQTAFEYGCRAWVSRFRSIEAVRQYLESGRAIIASIRVGEGELRGARYPKSNGHLVVITGLKKNKVLVNDPYSAGPQGAEIEYERDDIEKVWLDRGGVAILIEPKK